MTIRRYTSEQLIAMSKKIQANPQGFLSAGVTRSAGGSVPARVDNPVIRKPAGVGVIDGTPLPTAAVKAMVDGFTPPTKTAPTTTSVTDAVRSRISEMAKSRTAFTTGSGTTRTRSAAAHRTRLGPKAQALQAALARKKAAGKASEKELAHLKRIRERRKSYNAREAK